MLFLVVDDDTLNRELLTVLLEAEGYEVETVAGGEAAVARIASSAADAPSDAEERVRLPDVILADIQMPGLAGDALATALRAEWNAAAAPDNTTVLLAMSGSQPASSSLTGFDGFLLKPFQVSELRSLVQELVAGRAGPGAAAQTEKSAQETEPAGAKLPDANPAALDEDIYARMCDLMPVAQLGQMYALCIDDARGRIARMVTLVAEGDDAEYRREAHAVKGGAGMIGASELYQLASAAEQHGLSPREPTSGTSSVTAPLARLSLACDRLERILQERMRE